MRHDPEMDGQFVDSFIQARLRGPQAFAAWVDTLPLPGSGAKETDGQTWNPPGASEQAATNSSTSAKDAGVLPKAADIADAKAEEAGQTENLSDATEQAATGDEGTVFTYKPGKMYDTPAGPPVSLMTSPGTGTAQMGTDGETPEGERGSSSKFGVPPSAFKDLMDEMEADNDKNYYETCQQNIRDCTEAIDALYAQGLPQNVINERIYELENERDEKNAKAKEEWENTNKFIEEKRETGRIGEGNPLAGPEEREYTDEQALLLYTQGRAYMLDDNSYAWAAQWYENHRDLVDGVIALREDDGVGVELYDNGIYVLGEGAAKLRDFANDPYLPEEDAMRLLLQMGEDQDRAREGGFKNLDAYYKAVPEALDAYTPYIDLAAQNKADEERERQRLLEEQKANLRAMVEGALHRTALDMATEEDQQVLDFVNAQPVGMGMGDEVFDDMMNQISSVAMNDPQVYDEMRAVIEEQERYASAMGMKLDEYWETYPDAAQNIAQYDEAARQRLEVKWNTPPDGNAVTLGIAALNFLLGEDVVRETSDNEGVGLWTTMTRGIKDGTLNLGASVLDAIYFGAWGLAAEENAGINTDKYRRKFGTRWREYLREDMLSIIARMSDEDERAYWTHQVETARDISDVGLDMNWLGEKIRNKSGDLRNEVKLSSYYMMENATPTEYLGYTVAQGVTEGIECLTLIKGTIAVTGSTIAGTAGVPGIIEYGRSTGSVYRETHDWKLSQSVGVANAIVTAVTDTLYYEGYKGLMQLKDLSRIGGYKAVSDIGAPAVRTIGKTLGYEGLAVGAGGGVKFVESTTMQTLDAYLLGEEIDPGEIFDQALRESCMGALIMPVLAIYMRGSGKAQSLAGQILRSGQPITRDMYTNVMTEWRAEASAGTDIAISGANMAVPNRNTGMPFVNFAVTGKDAVMSGTEVTGTGIAPAETGIAATSTDSAAPNVDKVFFLELSKASVQAEADALTVQGVQSGQLITDEVLSAQKTNKQETETADKLAAQAAEYESTAARHDRQVQEATEQLLSGEGDSKALGEKIQKEAEARDEAQGKADGLRAQEQEHRGLAQEAQTQLNDLMQQGMNELRRQSLSQAVANNVLSMETIQMQAAARAGGVAAAYEGLDTKDRKVKRYIGDFTRRTGVEVTFEKLGPGIEGYYDRENGRMVLSSKLDGASAVKAVSVHELTHHLEGTAGYDEYAAFVLESRYGSDEAALSEAIAQTTEAYARAGIELDEDGARRELVAQATREVIYADSAAVDRLVRTDRNAAQRIYDGIKDFVKGLGVDRNDPQYADIRKAQKLFENTLNEKKTLAGGEGADGNLPEIQYTIEKSFYQQIDEVQKGTFPINDQVYISNTNEVLRVLGVKELPILMSPDKLKRVMGKEGRVDGKNQHGLTIRQLGQLPKAMEQPLAVIGSKSVPGRIIVMTSLTDAKGNSIVVPIELNTKGRLGGEYVDAHVAASAYGKSHAENMFMQAIADNEIYYVDAKKCRSFGWEAELQSLGAIPKNGYIRMIPQISSDVNNQSTQDGGKNASGKQFSVEQGAEGGTEDESANALTEDRSLENREMPEEMGNPQDGNDATARTETGEEENLMEQDAETEAPMEKTEEGLKKLPSSYIDKSTEKHTPEQIERMWNYKNAVDPRILEMAQMYREDKHAKFKRLTISEVSEHEAKDILSLTGVDVSGYVHAVDRNFFEHVERRHGPDGQQDRSMADLNDVARATYVINNYDDVKLLVENDGTPTTTIAYVDKNAKPDLLIQYSKQIDGVAYVVEAVGSNAWRKLWLLSAYIKK